MSKAIQPARSERLMHALYDAQLDLAELARQERLTLTRLAGWGNEPNTVEALEGLCRLNDVRAQLLVSRYRTLAAARLFDLSRDEGGGESVRKACVDLLKVSLVPIVEKASGAVERPVIVDVAEVRELLAEMGREEDEGGREAASGAGNGREAASGANVECETASGVTGDCDNGHGEEITSQ